MLEAFLLVLFVLFVGTAVLFGGEAALTVTFIAILIAVVALFAKFPGEAFVIFSILIIIGIILVALNKNPKSKVKSAGGCLLGIIGGLVMLPGAIAAFFVITLNGSEILGVLAAFACMILGYLLIKIASDD